MRVVFPLVEVVTDSRLGACAGPIATQRLGQPVSGLPRTQPYHHSRSSLPPPGGPVAPEGRYDSTTAACPRHWLFSTSPPSPLVVLLRYQALSLSSASPRSLLREVSYITQHVLAPR